MRAAFIALSFCASLAACVPENGPDMRPGEDCMACHSPSGYRGSLSNGERDRHASPAWNISGTVFASATSYTGLQDARVHITDANGWSFSLRSNEVGNFYSAESPVFPLHVCLEANGKTSCQTSTIPNGSCNSCHIIGGAAGSALVAP